MGVRESYLKSICVNEFGGGKHSKPSTNEFINSDFRATIQEVYSELNGKILIPPTRFGPWDIDLKEFVIELDEERHFNRYRFSTLNSNFYKYCSCFEVDKYKDYCLNFEKECLKSAAWGGSWKNDSTERQFGISNESGNLEGNGSSRWKQRAFYDFLKDVSSKIISIPIIRISIYDRINSFTINELIVQNRRDELIEYIDKLRSSQNYDC